MKRFLARLFLFLLLFLLINLILYKIGQKIYFQKYGRPNLTFEAYLLADSHGRRLGTQIESYGIFNFSDAGDSYEDMSRKLNYLIRNTSVKTIYLSVDDHTLSPSKEIRNNQDQSVIFTSVEDYKNPYICLKTKYLQRYIPLLHAKLGKIIRWNYIQSTKRYLVTNQNPKQTRPPKNWSDKSLKTRQKQSQLRADDFFTFEYRSKKLEQTLLEMIALCKKNNIEIIGVKFPLAADYSAIIEGKSYGASELLKSKGYQVLDFSSIFKDKNIYFSNSDHLNQDGAKIFLATLFRKAMPQTNHDLIWPPIEPSKLDTP